jgi:hypothetical protein
MRNCLHLSNKMPDLSKPDVRVAGRDGLAGSHRNLSGTVGGESEAGALEAVTAR